MAKKTNDYFAMLRKQMDCCVEASDLLEEILCNFQPETVNVYRSQMHEIEHIADNVRHDILCKLFTEFMTPIDQEDILRLAQIMDDITDALDEVILDVYMYRIRCIPEKTAEFSKIVNRCVKTLHTAIGELKNFKRPEKLRQLLIAVHDMESEADGVFTDAVYRLFDSAADGKTILMAKAIYEGLEKCCDLCEHAADVIEQVVIKNT